MWNFRDVWKKSSIIWALWDINLWISPVSGWSNKGHLKVQSSFGTKLKQLHSNFLFGFHPTKQCQGNTLIPVSILRWFNMFNQPVFQQKTAKVQIYAENSTGSGNSGSMKKATVTLTPEENSIQSSLNKLPVTNSVMSSKKHIYDSNKINKQQIVTTVNQHSYCWLMAEIPFPPGMYPPKPCK